MEVADEIFCEGGATLRWKLQMKFSVKVVPH